MVSTLAPVPTLVHGGFTVQPNTGVSPTTGNVLSIFPDRTLIVDVLTEAIYNGFLIANADLFENPLHYAGAWTAGGRVYLDVSLVVGDEAEALRLALAHNQRAYWSLDRDEEVFVGTCRMCDAVGKVCNGGYCDDCH